MTVEEIVEREIAKLPTAGAQHNALVGKPFALAVAKAVVEECAKRCESLMNGHGTGVCASEIRALAAPVAAKERGR
jgi:hypothetical protein